MDTIYAEATPPGRGGVSIVRVSGPLAHQLLRDLTGTEPEARRLTRCTLRDAGEAIDDAMAVRFDAGSSFTGEDSAEFHVHGAPAVVTRLSAALQSRGARLAEPGEFTRRAFTNGRMDLTEVEGLADLLAAETEAQRKQAMRVATGELRAHAEIWRDRLIQAGALLTAEIDFPDEDVPDRRDPRVAQLIQQTRLDIAEVVASAPLAEQLKRGFEVAIVGEPNVGKSSLLNAIARRSVALVSDIAGTTRDVIEFRTDLHGLPVTFLDMAGLRETDDRLESMGIAAARQRADAADLRVHLLSGESGSDVEFRDGDIRLQSKGDLRHDHLPAVSSVTGAGIADLLSDIFTTLRDRIGSGGLATHERQVQALELAESALQIPPDAPAELADADLRTAMQALAKLIGRVEVDDYLDLVFSQFCIGK